MNPENRLFPAGAKAPGDPMDRTQDLVQAALDSLLEHDGIVTVGLTARNGLALASPRGSHPSPETLTAMGAAAFAAAESALRGLSNLRLTRLQAESGGHRLVVFGGHERWLLIAVAEPSTPWDLAYEAAKETSGRIATIVAE